MSKSKTQICLVCHQKTNRSLKNLECKYVQRGYNTDGGVFSTEQMKVYICPHCGADL